MSLQKFSGSEDSAMTGFVVVDLDGAESADGVVRCAKKILQDGARTMARSRTYSWALLGRKVSGASAAINVDPSHRADGIAEFVEQVTPLVESGALSLDAGKGVGSSELSALAAVDRRAALRLDPSTFGTVADELLATGVLSAAATALDGLEGRTVAIEGAGSGLPALVAALRDAGAVIRSVATSKGTLSADTALDPDRLIDAWAAAGDDLPSVLSESGDSGAAAAVLEVAADLLLCGSKIGLVDHDIAAGLEVRAIAPIGVAPVTAKGLAVASRAGITVLPDFLTLAGPLVSFRPESELDADGARSSAQLLIAELTQAALADDDGVYLGACAIAERFLASWLDELPFGRPLA